MLFSCFTHTDALNYSFMRNCWYQIAELSHISWYMATISNSCLAFCHILVWCDTSKNSLKMWKTVLSTFFFLQWIAWLAIHSGHCYIWFFFLAWFLFSSTIIINYFTTLPLHAVLYWIKGWLYLIINFSCSSAHTR